MNPKCFHNKFTRFFYLFSFVVWMQRGSYLFQLFSLCLWGSLACSLLLDIIVTLFSSNSHYLGSSILYLFWNTVLELSVHFLHSPIFKYIITLLNPVSLSHNSTLVAYLGMHKCSWVMNIMSNRIMESFRLEKTLKIISITSSLFLCPFQNPDQLKNQLLKNFLESLGAPVIKPWNTIWNINYDGIIKSTRFSCKEPGCCQSSML